MKHVALSLLVVLLSGFVRAQIIVPGADGSDGVLIVTNNTVIDLGLAPRGQWDDNNAAQAGVGVYDSNQWAVVFKYSAVRVASGVTLSFKNHASRAPVVWLVNGNVEIEGDIILNGEDYRSAPLLAEPGPGGFRGGQAYFVPGADRSAGFGVGGGNRSGDTRYGFAASFGTQGQNGPATYGNPSLIPLIGGSGGAGSREYGGGAGGGAMLIAATGELNLTGRILANGGTGRDYNASGSGSGGGVRLVCGTLSGDGQIQAVGRTGGYDGGLGRVRVERAVNSSDITVTPDPSVIGLADAATALVWPPATAPTVQIISVGEVAVPSDPRSGFGTLGADVSLGQTNMSEVIIETRFVEQVSQVQVRVTPRSNADAVLIDSEVQSIVSEDPLVIRWRAEIPVQDGYSALQVKVIRP